MSRQITKISFKDKGDEGVDIVYKNYNQEGGKKDTTTKECTGLPAADFKNALNALINHAIFLTDFQDPDKFGEVPATIMDASIRVCGVSITGAEEKEGIMLSCYKTLKNGKGFAFNSPNTKWSEEGYAFMAELQEAVEVLKKEAGLYMAGKYAAKQLELGMDDTQKESLPAPSGSAGHFIEDEK